MKNENIKVGARNSLSDRQRIRKVRALAREIDGITIEIEPNDDDPEPEMPETMFYPDKALVAFGDPVKSLGDGRVGGYLVRFTDPESPDLVDDFFDKSTDFDRDFPTSQTAYFNHGLDVKFGTRKLGKANLTEDEFGIWAELILQERDEYEKFIAELAQAGKLGWSSGSAGHLVRRTQAGKANHIDYWPIADASLTHVPAEPRNTVIPLKSLSDIQTLSPLQANAEADQSSAQSEAEQATKTITLETGTVPEPEEMTMEITEEKLQEMLTGAVETALKAMPAVEVPESDVSVTKDEADQGFEHPGDYFKAVKTVAMYHDEDVRLKPYKSTGLSEGFPADGGYLVPQAMASGIMSHMYDVNQILGRVSRDSVAGNNMSYNGINETTHVGSIFGGVIPYWMGEGGTKTASKPSFWQLELKLKKLAALCYATDELLSDAPALQTWLLRNVPDALRFYAEEAIINGDGVGKPLGITQSPSLITQLRVDASEVDLTDIANMWARRWAGYSDYVWLVNPTVVPQLHIMVAATAPVYMPAGNIAGSPFGTIYGRPVIETEHCQALGTAGDIILASMSQYQTIDKGGIQAASSMHVAFTTDEMAYRFVYRIDGGSLWNSALTPVHGSTTFSPFVVLGASV